MSETQTEKESLAAEIETLEEQVETIKADLKAKKTAADQLAAEQERKQQATQLVEKYPAEGMTLENIENLLK